MKKIFLSSILAASILSTSAFGAIASSISGGWATYLYLASAAGGTSLAIDIVNDDISPGYERSMAWFAGITILILLDEDTKRASFPDLTEELIEKTNLTVDEQNSYSKDLKALRLTLDHLASNAKEVNFENAEEVVAEMDNVFTGNFTEATISAIDKIRSYNNELVNAKK